MSAVERPQSTREYLYDLCARDLAISWLAGCDATAFLYVCHNTARVAPSYRASPHAKP